jgi:hypothetical protein
MLKQQAKLFNRLNLLVDLLVVLSAFFLAYVLRARLGGLHSLREYQWILLVALPVWGFLLARYGFYSSLRRRSIFQIITALINVHLLAGMMGASLIFLFEPPGVSRLFYLAFVLIAFLLLTLEKVALRLVLGSIRRRGYNSSTSLDELPQFRNVLRGEMSLVGTRPPTPEEVGHYQNWQRRRISIHPGITGLWQVSGRKTTSAISTRWCAST